MLGKPHPEQDRVGGRPGPPGRARVVRPFPRVGRSIPRATGGPDEWLLPPPDERGNRIRLTDLLRRIQLLPGARAVLGRGCAAPCAPPMPPDPAPHAAKPRAAYPSVRRAGGALTACGREEYSPGQLWGEVGGGGWGARECGVALHGQWEGWG